MTWLFRRRPKAPSVVRKRTRESRAIVRRAGTIPYAWDPPVYRGETFDYDEKAPDIHD